MSPKREKPTTNIENCEFYGVKWDAKAIESVKIVAEALKENGIALSKLADVFKSQNIQIEALIKIDQDKEAK